MVSTVQLNEVKLIHDRVLFKLHKLKIALI